MKPDATGNRTTLLPLATGLAPRAMPARSVLPTRILSVFSRRETGAVAIIAALAIPVLVGFAGLALEYGQLLVGGESISIAATDTTFLISAVGTEPSGWACRGQAFCVTAGYSNARFAAPQSGPFTDLAVIGPLDPSRRAGALFAAGASGSQMSGALYFPNGPITLSGGASANAGATGCLQLIGSEISMSGGTSVASQCNLPQSGGTGQVALLR